MEVILKQDFQGLGSKNDTVRVRPGYGRNYLIPQGIAVVANTTNRKIASENIRQAAHKVAKLREDAEALVIRVGQAAIEIKARVGEQNRIFGSVTAAHLASALASQRIFVDSKAIRIAEPVRELGVHQATITLHGDIVGKLTFNVVAE